MKKIVCIFLTLFLFLCVACTNPSTPTPEITPTPDAKTKNVYEKLKDGEEVNILILGDSIADSASWNTLLKDLLAKEYSEDTYNSKINVSKMSMGGTSSYYGYVQLIAKEDMTGDDTIYDMVIVCYGQNDDDKELSKYYELILRNAKLMNKNCEIICILQHCQRTYTKKINDIIKLADHYGATKLDMIDVFYNTDMIADDYLSDGIHLNGEGSKVYAENIFNLIKKNVEESKQVTYGVAEPINERIEMFDKAKYVSIGDAKKLDEGSYEFTFDSNILALGMCYYMADGGSDINIYAGDKLIGTKDGRWYWKDQYFIEGQQAIGRVTDDVPENTKSIRVEFSLPTRVLGIIYNFE